ncbi:MAG: hypothetical protein WC596_02160 [Candidatus Shapirobacteria bacterium]
MEREEEEKQWMEYWRQVDREVREEMARQDPLREIQHRRFISNSNGRNRPQRSRPRLVELIKIDNYVYTTGEDCLLSRKDKHGLCGDRLAQQFGYDDQSKFLDAIRRRSG